MNVSSSLPLQQFFLAAGALLGFLGVAAGAFGAHVLKSKLSLQLLETFETAVRYQMYHSLVLVIIALIMYIQPSLWLSWSGILFFFGILVFSGSLYILVFSGIRAWGAVTPIGGLLLLLGWFCLFFSALFSKTFIG